MIRGEMIAKLREWQYDFSDYQQSDDFKDIADALEQETKDLERVRDWMNGPCGDQVKLNGREIFTGVPMPTIRKWADALTKVIGDGK